MTGKQQSCFILFRNHTVLFFLQSLFFVPNLYAEVGPKNQYFLVKDLSQEWVVYSQKEKEYVPYVPEQHNTLLSINTIIDIESNLNYDLLIYVSKQNYLFLNNSLQENLKAGTWRVMRIDSLYKIYQRPQLMLTIYGTPGQVGKTVLIAHRKALIEKLITIEEKSLLNLKPREIQTTANFFVLGILFLITMITFLFNSFPRAFERFYNVLDFLQINARDDSFLTNRPLNRANLFFIGLLSLELGYLYLFAQAKQFNFFSSKELLLSGQTLSETCLDYFKISILCFVIMIGKYVGLSILCSLYRLEGIANIHYFKIIQSSLLFYTTILVLVSFASLYVYDWSSLVYYFLIIPGIIFYAFRIVLLFFTISNATTIKSLYLISYLCIVELIPLIIGVRYVL